MLVNIHPLNCPNIPCTASAKFKISPNHYLHIYRQLCAKIYKKMVYLLKCCTLFNLTITIPVHYQRKAVSKKDQFSSSSFAGVTHFLPLASAR